jgi:ubiquinone/menaquinone biosynthesis C-methylase UbiE
MAREQPERSFKEMERDGWHGNAPHYDERAGKLTQVANVRLLEAVRAGAGQRLLDVCCGPGYAAGAAAARGLTAVGVDLAPAMISEARRRFPRAEFQYGDAEALNFPEASFDVVICAFGLVHLPEPARGMAEAFRVLKPGGRYGVATWCMPDRAELLAIALNAIKAHADMTVPLPPAPSVFAYSEPATGREALERVGFRDISVEEVDITYQGRVPEDVFDWLEKSTVRTMALFRLQTPDVQARIRRAILEAAAAFRVGDALQVPCHALIYAARKP